jgi:pimeloyl-ACP methyl ester carboxylesterase
MAYAHTFKAKFPSGIVAEFLPPNEPSNRVVILCDGLPSVPAKKDVLRHLSDHGFWSFHLRYRGTWESDGDFLKESPHKDINLLIGELANKFRDVWSGQQFRIKTPQFMVIGSSFGGTAAILASLNPQVCKSVALAPVCDWKKRNRTEPLSHLKRVIREGFGPVYRFSEEDWKKLESGHIFNPAEIDDGFDSQKLMIIHTDDDPIVHVSQSVAFCHKHVLRLVKLPQGGHLSVSHVPHLHLWQKIARFLNAPTRASLKKRVLSNGDSIVERM